MSQNVLVIVESPTKARTLQKFLGKDYIIEASVGHVRDLPQKASEVPKEFKKLPWATLGIDVENGFRPLYVIPREKSKVIDTLKKRLKQATEVLLATDEDREGESISWHLMEVLRPQVPVRRMVFHEITRNAILNALENTRSIDMNLVEAQETRRILDRLVGYTLSPVLWKKIAYGLSAGRVQSPGLRMLVERELERCRFQSAEYWSLTATLEEARHQFEAQLVELAGVRIARGKDFDPETGALPPDSGLRMLDRPTAEALDQALRTGSWVVESVQEKEVLQKPPIPFITSTLQQEANRKLRMSTRETSRVAQKLYEEGYITYMRTDSPSLSQEAIAGARRQVEELFGTEYLSDRPRQFSARSRNAQESHEAIRPVGERFLRPEETPLTGQDRALYEMIWKRTLASQMAEARKLQIIARIRCGDAVFLATGNRILFPGYLRVYVEGRDRPEEAWDDQESLLPPLKQGDRPLLVDLKTQAHQTKPPARYTEAGLVQRLEKEGIGRPSTYATIISTLLDRGYAFKKDNALVPTFTGIAVTTIMLQSFADLVDYKFTSEMEDHLDRIAEGKGEKLTYLQNFYLGPQGLAQRAKQEEERIDPERARTIFLPHLPDIPIRVSRYGPYLTVTGPDGQTRNVNLDPQLPPSELTREMVQELIASGGRGPRLLGTDPSTGKPVYLALGRYGYHLQLGTKDDAEKPKTAGLLPGMDPNALTLEQALALLSLPRTLGTHPETGHPVLVGNGRYGPYVAHAGEYRSLKKTDDALSLTLERALELLNEPRQGRRGVTVLADLGVDPKSKRKVQILKGRFGPYARVGTMNLSLPKGLSEEEARTWTLEQVLALREEKAGAQKAVSKTPSMRGRGRGKATG